MTSTRIRRVRAACYCLLCSRMTDIPSHTAVFLEKIDSLEPLPASHIHAMNTAYGFNSNPNAEIRSRWYAVALKSPAQADFAKVSNTYIYTVCFNTRPDGFCNCRPRLSGLSATSRRARLAVASKAA